MPNMTKTRAEQSKERARRQTADAQRKKADGARQLADKLGVAADEAEEKSEAQLLQDDRRDQMQHGRAAPATPQEAKMVSAAAVKESLARGERAEGFAPPMFNPDVEKENPYTTEKDESIVLAADRRLDAATNSDGSLAPPTLDPDADEETYEKSEAEAEADRRYLHD